MGCCQLTQTLENSEFSFTDKPPLKDAEYSPEELEVQSWENEIGFNSLQTRDLIDRLLSICHRESIPESDFQNIVEEFHLSTEPSKYKRFRDKNGFSLVKIAFAGILLGNGTNEDKLYCLFSVLDVNGSGFLDKHELISAISMLVNCSVLVSDKDSAYLAELIKIKPLAITKLIHEVCIYDECSQTQLRELLMVKEFWFLFSSKAVRGWIRAVGSCERVVQVRATEESTERQMAARVGTESATSSLSVVSEVLPGNVREAALSSSSDSNGPVCLQVNLSTEGKACFYFYINEDPFEKAEEFSNHHGLSQADKDRLLNSVSKIKNQVS